MAQRASDGEPPRYVRAPTPLVFPEEAELPESRRHLELRTILFQLLFDELADHATIGSEQFVYWDAGDPRTCLAPDAFVRLGSPDAAFGSWKVWERGAPDVCVEIVSESDAPEADWQGKLAKYLHLGTNEVVRFDAREGATSLRVWDRVMGDLVERIAPGGRASSRLGLTFVVAPADGLEVALRIARADGTLVPTRREARKAEAEGRKAEAEGRRAEAEGRRAEQDAREAAERRVAELEAELRRRGG
jgi:Uma2 family endonuclease